MRYISVMLAMLVAIYVPAQEVEVIEEVIYELEEPTSVENEALLSHLNFSPLEYTWDATPDFKVPDSIGDNSELIVKDFSAIEYIIEDDAFMQYDLNHLVTYIVNETGVEANNKVYLSTGFDEEVVFQKARVINSKGEVIEFNDKDILEGEDEQSGFKYNYYALDGLDIGSFVEIIFLTKQQANYDGANVIIQSSVPKENVEFVVVSPEHLEFEFLPLNNIGTIELDEAFKKHSYRNLYRFKTDRMEALKGEPIAFTKSNLQGFIYKLSKNKDSGRTDLTSYDATSMQYFKYIYEMNGSKTDLKGVESVIKAAGISKNMSDLKKVEQLEDYIKSNYVVLPYSIEELKGISNLLKNNASDASTFVALYANALMELGIKHELVLTSDRTSNKFDKDFEAINFLQKAVVYFPELDKYLDPEAADLRLGFIPWEYTENYGLFIKPIKTNKVATGIGSVKFIEALDEKQSAFNHYITVDMREDVYEPTIDFDVQMSGYYSTFLQTGYEYLSEEEQEKTDASIKEMILNESSSAPLKLEHANAAAFGKQPLSMQIEVQTPNFTEKAGNKILLKVGDLIGEQTELYNEEPRKLSIENDYNRTFDRKITVLVPEDYTISNLDKLNFDFRMPDNTAVFKSTYDFADNQLVIDINEYYSRINFSVEEFEAYKKVINAAADFNKVVLYLEKK